MAIKLNPAPIVNLNTNAVIKEIFGGYNIYNQDIIKQIADNEANLIKGCRNLGELKANIENYIDNVMGYNE